jgi:anti-sigma regulatory factor (Ser/Thr protein kinase)
VRLQQVISNLLTNAIQFSNHGERIEVALQARSRHLVVRVRDTGVGIDADFLPHVFDKFRQAEGGISRRHGGLGVGLSIAKQIVDLHGGTIEVSSSGRDQGTCVEVSLPEATPSEQALQKHHPDAPILTGVGILIAGGDHESRDVLGGMLEASGAAVAVLSAPKPAAGPPPAVIVLLDPLDATDADALRQHLHALADRPVILSENVAATALVGLGSGELFGRPFTPGHFVGTIARHLAAA